MGLSDWLRPTRHLLAIVAGVTLVPAAILVWLGWKVLELDRRLDGQRAGAGGSRRGPNRRQALAAAAGDKQSARAVDRATAGGVGDGSGRGAARASRC
jgi:hypothetical protein